MIPMGVFACIRHFSLRNRKDSRFLVSEPSTGSWMKLALVINQSVSRMVLPRLIGKLVSQMIF